jgi:hypothetical protein
VYFSGPWENILALWQYFKIILFQITNKSKLTLPNQSNIPFPNPARGHQRPPSATLFYFYFGSLQFDAKLLIKKLPKFGKINFGTAIVY